MTKENGRLDGRPFSILALAGNVSRGLGPSDAGGEMRPLIRGRSVGAVTRPSERKGWMIYASGSWEWGAEAIRRERAARDIWKARASMRDRPFRANLIARHALGRDSRALASVL